MKEHKHKTIKEAKRVGIMCGTSAYCASLISIILFAFGDFEKGLIVMSGSITLWAFFTSILIAIGSRNTRIMLAKIHNVDEFYWCEKCHPKEGDIM